MTNHPIEPHPALVRVAKSIWEELSRRYSVDDVECQGAARAALLSLRELTPDVVEAAKIAAVTTPPYPADDVIRAEWVAMINTIIGEAE